MATIREFRMVQTDDIGQVHRRKIIAICGLLRLSSFICIYF